MNDNLRATLDELAEVTDRLGEINPNEFAFLSDLLTERSKLTIRLHRMVANLEITPTQAHIDRLAKELSRGAEILRRLEVARAGIRAEYQKTARTSGLMRSLETVSPPRDSHLDVQG